MGSEKCYICGEGKKSNGKESKVCCIGISLCAQLHEVQSMLEAELPEMLTVKRLRHEASISVHAEATAGRWFHPSCLGRDPAGASNHHWYGLDNDTRRCSKRDQTHKLCGDCLKLWCDSEGEVRGEAGFLARNMEEGLRQTCLYPYYCMLIRIILPLGLNVQLQIFAPTHLNTPTDRLTYVHVLPLVYLP